MPLPALLHEVLHSSDQREGLNCYTIVKSYSNHTRRGQSRAAGHVRGREADIEQTKKREMGPLRYIIKNSPPPLQEESPMCFGLYINLETVVNSCCEPSSG